MSYGDLGQRSDHLAARLRAAGVRRNEIVGLYTGRNAGLIVGILGILKAGAAYLPMDPATPSARVHMVIADSSVRIVVTDSDHDDQVDGLDVKLINPLTNANGIAATADPIILAELPHIGKDDLAYVIYTSGSTGQPKGVLIDHGSVLRLFRQTAGWCDVSADDVWTMFHSVAFDFSVWELWGALLHGARLIIVPVEVSRSPARFRELVTREGVTVLSQTPSAFRLFERADRHSGAIGTDNLRYVVFGGERLDISTVEPWIGRHGVRRPELINMYGLTEGTVHVSAHRVGTADLATPHVSNIGVPLGDLRFTVHKPSGEEVEPGATGELWVHGRGVSQGYLNRPDLTAKAFVSGCEPSERCYRTGDLVRELNSGEFAYLGRLDDQIQIRGFRIEPAEIEMALTTHPEVAAAVVTTRDYGDGDVRLVANLVPASPRVGDGWIEQIVDELREQMDNFPLYMRPSSYVPALGAPMTRNGKLDRDALRSDRDDDIRPALNLDEIASTIERTWEDILGVDTVDRNRDFFDLGGTSLALIRMFERVNRHYGTELDIAVLVEGATIQVIATKVHTELCGTVIRTPDK